MASLGELGLVPVVRRVVPRVVAIFQDPRKVVTLFAGALLLDMSFVAALTCATRAFGATPSIPAVAVVYFAGAIIGSAVPTPGGERNLLVLAAAAIAGVDRAFTIGGAQAVGALSAT